MKVALNAVFNYFLGPPSTQITYDGAFFREDRPALLALIDSYAGIPPQVGEMIANYVVGDQTRFHFRGQDITDIFFRGAMPIECRFLVIAALIKTAAEVLEVSIRSPKGTFRSIMTPKIKLNVQLILHITAVWKMVKIALKQRGIEMDENRVLVITGCGALLTSTPLPYRIIVAAGIIRAISNGVKAVIAAQKILRPEVGQLYRYKGHTWLYSLDWRCVDFDY